MHTYTCLVLTVAELREQIVELMSGLVAERDALRERLRVADESTMRLLRISREQAAQAAQALEGHV
jgi:hypothetical protein